MLSISSLAPDFTRTSHAGERVSLAELCKSTVVVLYFYPRDHTPGCTVEACAFRDMYEDFTDAGAKVIGVSQDSEASHQSFARKHALPFLLLSDEDRSLQKLYNVQRTFGILPGRATYVIDRNQRVAHVFSSQVRVKDHMKLALDVVKSLAT